MRSRSYFLLIFAVGLFFGCSKNNDPLVAKQNDSTKGITVPQTSDAVNFFTPNQTDNPKKNALFVFVGEKLEIARLPSKPGDLDAGFLAKYKILEKHYGDYLKDTIEFEVYDHYGDPQFSKYRFALLFVSFHAEKFYHEKYQYFDIYKTKNGKWASPYHSGDYLHEYNEKTSIKPEKIEFAEDVYYDVSKLEKSEIRQWYPAPYYRVDQGKAKAVYGNYIPELFKLKRDSVLKARELF